MEKLEICTDIAVPVEEKRTISEESSKKITALRYLLMMLVIFGHNNYTALSVDSDMVFNQSVFGKWVQCLISDGIARGAVPVFFAMSSFLLFFKNDSYVVMLKKKAKSLLLPFLLWPVINMVFFALIKIAGDVTHIGLISGVGNYDFITWTPKDWFGNFFGYVNDGVLYLSQFWFMRDLIVLVILSPVLSYLYDKFKFIYIAILIYTEFIGVYTYFVLPESLFYFSVGMIWAKSGKDLFEIIKKIHFYEIIPVFLGLWLLLWKAQFAMISTVTLMAFVSGIMLLKFSEILIKNDKVYNALAYLAKYSFFLYAVHIKILRAIIRTTWVKLFPMTNGFFCLFEYFGVTITIVVAGTLLGAALKKICPKFFGILSGR